MTLPTATAAFRQMGKAVAKPRKADRAPRKGLKRTGFKQKTRRGEISVATMRRAVEQGLIDPAEYGLNRPRRKPMRLCRTGQPLVGPTPPG